MNYPWPVASSTGNNFGCRSEGFLSHDTSTRCTKRKTASSNRVSGAYWCDSNVCPDVVLCRSVTRTAQGNDSTNLMFAMAKSGVPCVNSLESITMFLERPSMHAGLKRMQQRLGPALFPLVCSVPCLLCCVCS